MVMTISACSNESSSSSISEAVSSETSDSTSVADSIPANSTVEVEEVASSEVNVEEESIEPREGDFRVGFWGDSVEVIEEYETAEYLAGDEEAILYIGDVAGKDAAIMYWFDEEGNLYQGSYSFLDEYNQGHSYIREYNSLKDSLIAKYGEPITDKVVKYSSSADYIDEGQALELGFTTYVAVWENDTTEITLGLVSENYEIEMLLRYKDINHEKIYNTEGL